MPIEHAQRTWYLVGSVRHTATALLCVLTLLCITYLLWKLGRRGR
jgi:hypothetical protein